MKDGFIKVAAATPEIRLADCKFNGEQIVRAIEAAQAQGAKVLVFPELCLTGYTCGDLFLQDLLLRAAEEALQSVMKQTADKDILCLVGLPLRRESRLYNCAAVFCRGELLGVVPKRNIPNYSEFYELRHFSPAGDGIEWITLAGQEVPFGQNLLFCCRELPEFVVAAEICEDLWVPQSPSIRHAAAGATILANLSASDETIGKSDYRRMLVEAQSAKLVCGYLYADAGEGESTTDLVFSGHNLIGENGAILAESALFQNGILYSEIDVQRLMSERRRMNTYPAVPAEEYLRVAFSMPLAETTLTRRVEMRPFVPEDGADRKKRCESIFAMQVNGLKKRLAHIGAKTAVIGISGGLDSCLALLVTVKTMDALHRSRKDILAVTMPCFGTTKRTKTNAEILCERLGVTFRTVEISESVLLHLRDIEHPTDVYDAAYENAQARERTQVLMDLANQTGGIVIGTGDLSELALGWATYNGDHMSMYGVNASIPKTLVRYMVDYVARDAGDAKLFEVLMDILDTPVSPELLPAKDNEIAQKTEDLVGPYELHDFFLYQVMRMGFAPAKVYRLAVYAFRGVFSPDVIQKWLRTFYWRFFAQQFKRSCLPDGPKVGSVTLSPRGDWRMPSDACVRLWLDEVENL